MSDYIVIGPMSADDQTMMLYYYTQVPGVNPVNDQGLPKYASQADFLNNEFTQKVLIPMRNFYASRTGFVPATGLTTAAAANAAAASTYAAVLNAQPVGAYGFILTGAANTSTIANGASGSYVGTLTFETSYTGVVTWSAKVGASSPGGAVPNITFSFSPSTSNSTGATVTVTVTVASGVPASSYPAYLIGTDANGISNSLGFLIITS